ncbi:MAG: hypothetical protein LC634_05145 [Sphingomonadales bacterium]|nr:hypothetical protein [Sphingomonadales bacterium]
MNIRYRVVHERKHIVEALFSGRTWTDWYLAQHKRWWGWKTLGSFQTPEEAEGCCAEHADGKLTPTGGRIVSEFTEKDEP